MTFAELKRIKKVDALRGAEEFDHGEGFHIVDHTLELECCGMPRTYLLGYTSIMCKLNGTTYRVKSY